MFHEVCARAGIAARGEDSTKLDIHALRVVPPLEGAKKVAEDDLTQRACRSNS
jgi:hypothetical protein